jgi:hypothetical protein
MKTRAWFTVDYDESKQSSYRAFVVKFTLPTGEETERRFETGDPIIDFLDYHIWLSRDSVQELISSVGFSSSYDHFFMDGNRYKALHVLVTDEIDEAGKRIIKSYSSEEAVSLPNKEFNALTEYITRHPYTTFEQVKAYYRKKKRVPKEVETLLEETGVFDPINEYSLTK